MAGPPSCDFPMLPELNPGGWSIPLLPVISGANVMRPSPRSRSFVPAKNGCRFPIDAESFQVRIPVFIRTVKGVTFYLTDNCYTDNCNT
jgi:hypothetical protein